MHMWHAIPNTCIGRRMPQQGNFRFWHLLVWELYILRSLILLESNHIPRNLYANMHMVQFWWWSKDIEIRAAFFSLFFKKQVLKNQDHFSSIKISPMFFAFPKDNKCGAINLWTCLIHLAAMEEFAELERNHEGWTSLLTCSIYSWLVHPNLRGYLWLNLHSKQAFSKLSCNSRKPLFHEVASGNFTLRAYFPRKFPYPFIAGFYSSFLLSMAYFMPVYCWSLAL